jgi:carboxylesterase
VDRTAIDAGREYELGGGPDAVLLLHGLTGSPFELHPVALRLHAAGMRCLAPVLPGHGGGPEDLLEVGWTDWIAGAERHLRRLEGARRTFVVGCSMGALVACALAHDHPGRVAGLVLLAPALELAWQGRIGAALGRLGPLRRVIVPKAAGSDVRDPEMRRRNPGVPGLPLAAVAELAALQAHAERLLPGVAAPALVVAGAHDHTVTLAGALRLARRIGSGPAEVRVLAESWHLVGIDVDRDECAEATLAFLDAIPAAAPARAKAPARAAPRTRRRPGRGGARKRRGRPRARKGDR